MLKILLIFFEMHLLKSICFNQFHERQLKALEQFEAKVYSFSKK